MRCRHSVLVLLATAVFCSGADADTFFVSNTNDSGPGSLREAINNGNASTDPGFHLVRFNVPCPSGGGKPTIFLQSDLPAVTGAIDIDGSTGCGNVLIDCNGRNTGMAFAYHPNGASSGLFQALRHVDIQQASVGVSNGAYDQSSVHTGLLVTGCTINAFLRGISLQGVNGAVIGEITNPGASAPLSGGNVIPTGIYIFGGGGHMVRGNLIGASPNIGNVLIDESSNNTIGGDGMAEGNIIIPKGNTGIGVCIRNGNGGNKILGNKITLDQATVVPNPPRGVLVSYSPNNLLQNNVISVAGGSADIYVEGAASTGTKVFGNFIGATADATTAVNVAVAGIELIQTSGVTVGSATPGFGNIIGGTSSTGILLSRASQVVIQGNFIGTNTTGVTDLGSSGYGIHINGTSNATIGGSSPGEGNTIAFSGAGGIVIDPSSSGTPASIRDSIRGNSIYQNGGTTSGIDLNSDGVTANDIGDTDDGANHLQNFPVLSSAVSKIGDNSVLSTTITGSLSSAPSGTYTVDFYRAGPSPNNDRARQFYLGNQQVTTDATGNASFTYVVTEPAPIPGGHFVTATATDSAGNTSEFSAAIAVSDPQSNSTRSQDVQLTGSVSTATANPGATIEYDFVLPAISAFSQRIFTDTLPAGLTLGDVTVTNGNSIYGKPFPTYSVARSGNTVTITFTGDNPNDVRIALGAKIDSTVARGTVLVNRATLRSREMDPDPFNNYVALTTRVSDASQLLNISSRMPVLTGDGAAIAGFIVSGSGPKKLIIRGIGPALRSAGIGDALNDPTLELHDATGAVLATNDNWKDTDQAAISATGLAPTNDAEAAILATLPANNSLYSAVLRGKNDTIGVGLVEVYDLAPDTDSRLANISTRGYVDRFDNVLIGGLIVGPSGSGKTQFVVRAIGPSIASVVPGALGDPTLELHDINGATIDTNNDWKERQQNELQATGLAPTDDRESAIVSALVPGNYTAIVRGVNDTTGVAVVEAYSLP